MPPLDPYADMPPLCCGECGFALSLGGWVYEEETPTLHFCTCPTCEG